MDKALTKYYKRSPPQPTMSILPTKLIIYNSHNTRSSAITIKYMQNKK